MSRYPHDISRESDHQPTADEYVNIFYLDRTLWYVLFLTLPFLGRVWMLINITFMLFKFIFLNNGRHTTAILKREPRWSGGKQVGKYRKFNFKSYEPIKFLTWYLNRTYYRKGQRASMTHSKTSRN